MRNQVAVLHPVIYLYSFDRLTIWSEFRFVFSSCYTASKSMTSPLASGLLPNGMSTKQSDWDIKVPNSDHLDINENADIPRM